MTLGGSLAGVAWSAPWWLSLVVAAWRWRGTPSLDDVAREAPQPAPPLTVIVPARNEAAHIASCVRSILASEYPFEWSPEDGSPIITSPFFTFDPSMIFDFSIIPTAKPARSYSLGW